MKKMKILVVDTDVVSFDYLVAILKKIINDPEIILEENSDEALRLTRFQKFDLIISNIWLKGTMDGYGLVAKIRAQETHETRKTKILAYSSYDLIGDKEKALKAGFDDFLPKGVHLDELQSVIKSLLPRPPHSRYDCKVMIITTYPLAHAFLCQPLQEISPDKLKVVMVDNHNQVLTAIQKEEEAVDVVIIDMDSPGPRNQRGPNAFQIAHAIKEKSDDVVCGGITTAFSLSLQENCREAGMQFLFDANRPVLELSNMITKARFPV